VKGRLLITDAVGGKAMERRGGWIPVGIALMGLMLLSPSALGHACAKAGTAVVVHVKESKLWLCSRGGATKEYAIAVGSGGAGKTVEGDKKTPVGDYSLGEPRASKEFGIFIPIGYPTDQQRKNGATGGDVGIHGPKRLFAWAGRINTWINWTRGCIAVATDTAIQQIADWIRHENVRSIHIE
jgi:murein L,D-transpeptidase YafK